MAPPKSLPEAILLNNAGTDIFAVTSLGWSESLHSAIFILNLNSSTPSKIKSTLVGFSRTYFQTASFKSREYSEKASSSRRVSGFSIEFNLLNLRRKTASKFNWEFSVSVSDAQSRRSLMQNKLFPIPGRPTTRTFLWWASIISRGWINGEFSLGLGYTFNCSCLSSEKSYSALPSWIIRLV